MGENGSGKSTMLRILSGQIQPGRRVHPIRRPTDLVPRRRPMRCARASRRSRRKRRSHSTSRLQRTSSSAIAWHCAAASSTGRRRARGRAPRSSGSGWSSTRRFPSADCGPDRQQMVEIARALSIDARLLILDEPTSSLTDDEVESLFAVVRKLRDDGVSTIFVSHRIDEVFELADRISVLRDGHSVGEAAAAELTRGRLIHMMVGRELEEEARAEEGRPSTTTAGRPRSPRADSRRRGFRRRRPRRRSRRDRRARRTGRSGKKRAAGDALRLRAASAGTVEIDGAQQALRSPRDAIRSRVGFVPADRKTQGLVLERSVRENLVMAATCRLPRLSYPRPAREAAVVENAFSSLQIKANSPSRLRLDPVRREPAEGRPREMARE